MNSFSIQPKIFFDGHICDFIKLCEGNRFFIVADPMMKELGFIDSITRSIQGRNKEFEVFDKITPDPQIETVASGVHEILVFQPDVLIAIGGGSAIDAAKGMMLSLKLITRTMKKPLFIAMPSTSGTGSEMTSFSIITIGKEKKPIIDQYMVPDIAVLDIDLVKSVPATVTADTGMDVLTHAIEAYVSTIANEFTDALAEKAIKLVFDNLVEAYRNGKNAVVRNKMHKASALAGMAFTNASLGINHSMSHGIGSIFHLPHGKINAVIMPKIIAYNAGLDQGVTDTAKSYQQIAKFLNLPASTPEEGTNSLIMAITFMNEELGIENNFSDLRVNKEQYIEQQHQIVELAFHDNCTATNPRKPTKNDLLEIYQLLYE